MAGVIGQNAPKGGKMPELVPNEEVSMIVESEGLGYAIMWYLNATQIEDPKLASLWQQASVPLHKINKYLEPYCNERQRI